MTRKELIVLFGLPVTLRKYGSIPLHADVN